MPRFNLCINSHMAFGNGAVPDIVVTFSASLEGAAVLGQDTTHFFLIFRHYRTILSCRSDLKIREKGCGSEAFRERSSGTAKRVRSRRASNEPDSRTSPGISLLVAIQTLASSSQVKVMIYYIKDTSCEYYMNIIVPQICISYSLPITLPRHKLRNIIGGRNFSKKIFPTIFRHIFFIEVFIIIYNDEYRKQYDHTEY